MHYPVSKIVQRQVLMLREREREKDLVDKCTTSQELKNKKTKEQHSHLYHEQNKNPV